MEALAEINKIPPVTRVIVGSSLAVSLPVMLEITSVFNLVYEKNLVFNRLEIWRLWTSFFYGGTGINFLFGLIMLYRTSETLESHHYTGRSADYAWQLMIAALGILGLNHPLRSFLFNRPFLLSLVYLSSRLSPHTAFSLFGLITIPALWWPYVLLGLDAMTGGTKMFTQSLTGVLVGHAWWLLIWRDTAARHPRLAQAPRWLKRLFLPRVVAAGTTGPQPRGFSASGGAATTQRPTAYQWGPGQQLGSR